MIKYIVFDSGSYASRLMFADIKKIPDAIGISNIFEISNPLLRVLNKVHMSGKINRKIRLPFREIWDKFCLIERAKMDSENDYVIVMTNVSSKKFRIEYLQALKDYSNIHLVLVAVDSFVDQFLCPLDIIKNVQFDLVYSFDRDDCEKYGMIHSQSQYSKVDEIEPYKESYDLFFVGRAKNRLKLIKDIALKANNQNLKCGFFLLDVPKREREHIDGVTYIDRVMPYSAVLPMIMSSKCLLDIVQQGQTGYTMRVYESIFYNKKLITNNSTILGFSYYQKKFMKVFNDISDIDFSFVENLDTAEYNYSGEYSPINLLKDAEKRIWGENAL